MIKRLSEYQFTPYRPIEIEELGEISPLKLRYTANDHEEVNVIEDDEGFQKIARKISQPNYIPEDQIFVNITTALDGFDRKEDNNVNSMER